MQAAKIVYAILGFVILLPWIVYNVKKAVKNARIDYDSGIRTNCSQRICPLSVYYRISDSSGSREAGKVFLQRIEGQMDLSAYQKEMQKQKLSPDQGIQTVSDEELKAAGFNPGRADVLLSEKSIPCRRRQYDRICVIR